MKAFVMVGAPGSGKSTQVKNIQSEFPDAIVACGDTIRGELYGDDNIQGDYREIHSRIVEIIEENVGKTIILDGTHYLASYRKQAITLLNSYGYNEVEAIVVDKPLEVCLQQNEARSRKVPKEVITTMHQKLSQSVKGIDKEGFSNVTFIR